MKITHPELGDVKGIITIGLDYSIYLSDGNVIIVNAEESPGKIYDSQYVVSEWGFDVQINMIEKYNMLSQNERKSQRQERIRSRLGSLNSFDQLEFAWRQMESLFWLFADFSKRLLCEVKKEESYYGADFP